MLTKIGNSKGVRIPKALIEQAHLDNVEIEFEVTSEGLLLKPKPFQHRQGWEKAIEKALHVKGVEETQEFLDIDLDTEGWEW